MSSAAPNPIRPSPSTPNLITPSLSELTGYFLRLGTLGFGGPVALVAAMRRDLVEARAWIPADEYKTGLALSQLAPGPLAAQLAIYLGYVHHGILGATMTGLAFVLPSFVMVVILGWAYSSFGGLPWMQAVFYTVSASVIGLIAWSAYKLSSKTLGKDRLLWVIALIACAWTVISETEAVWLFLLAGVIVWLIKAPPPALRFGAKTSSLAWIALVSLPNAQLVPNATLLSSVFWYFFQAGAFVFGSGLAIVPFLYGGVVKTNHWLTDAQFVDAVAVAMITPGPVVITTAFIGFLIAGLPGASLAALGTFLPAYLLTILPAPYFKRYGQRPDIAAFVDGVTAAATGAIISAVIVLGKRTLIDWPTWMFALAALSALWRSRKITEPVVVAVTAIIGLIVYPLLHPLVGP
jgi:chromate transporter